MNQNVQFLDCSFTLRTNHTTFHETQNHTDMYSKFNRINEKCINFYNFLFIWKTRFDVGSTRWHETRKKNNVFGLSILWGN